MKMKVLAAFVVVSIAALQLGCNSGSNSGKDADNNIKPSDPVLSIEGHVYDPAIENAVVMLCPQGDYSMVKDACLGERALTNAEGRYIINFDEPRAGLKDMQIIAFGGRDARTGVRFNDLFFSSPYGLVEGSNKNITPFTSMINALVGEGKSLDEARSQVLEVINVDLEKLTDFEKWGVDEQRKALILSKIALELSQNAGLGFSAIDLSSINKGDLTNLVQGTQYKDLYVELKKADSIPELFAIYFNERGLVDPGFSFIDKTSPLTNPLFLGINDIEASRAKRDYYFQSTASHLYQAESLTENEQDVALNDAVFSALVVAYLENGLPDLALRYIDKKIFQELTEARSLIRVADWLVIHGVLDDYNRVLIEILIDKAFETTKGIIDSKGLDNLTFTEVQLVADILTLYSSANLTKKAEIVSFYMSDLIDSIRPNMELVVDPLGTNLRLAVVQGLINSADKYLEFNNIAKAISLLEQAALVVDDMPPLVAMNTSMNFLQVFWYTQLVDRFADIGENARAFNLAEKAQQRRTYDVPAGKTDSNTFNITANLVAHSLSPVFVKGGYSLEKFTEFAKSTRGFFAVDDPKTWASWASNEARQVESLAQSKTIVDFLKEKIQIADADYIKVVEGLTYDRLNKSYPNVAMTLINEGKSQQAKWFIAAAEQLLDEHASSETSDLNRRLRLVQNGYAKLANLYQEINETHEADRLINKSLQIARGIEGVNGSIKDKRQQAEAFYYILFHLGQMGRSSQLEEVAIEALEINQELPTINEKLASLRQIWDRLEAFGDQKSMLVMRDLADRYYELVVGVNPLHPDGVGTENDNNARAQALGNIVTKWYAFVNQPEDVQKASSKMLEFINSLSVPNNKALRQIQLAEAYARVRDLVNVRAVIDSIDAPDRRNTAIQNSASALSKVDNFPFSSVAAIDFNLNGNPSFFNYGITYEALQASGLTIDADSDGDGVPDSQDLTPFYKP